MSLWFAIVMGAAQGLTEFLPISSTAHLRILPALLGQHDPGAAYTAVLQLGTLAAVLIYFARDVFVELPRALFTDPKSPRGRLPIYLVVATLPIAVAGIALEDFIVGDARSLWVVSGALVGVGVAMAVIDARARNARVIDDLRLVEAFVVGCAQALALVPGVSRSGATICCALLLGLRRTEAARFSFLLSIPAIAGAGVFQMDDAIEGLGADAVTPLVVGTVVSAIFGYASIAWLMRFLGTRRLVGFAAYRVALGVLLVALLAAGTLSPFAGV
ncbi:MAG: undecaprenyl-diphosphatase UppP [Deltaproteobacteria bacterium]|nr:undecaprenyl-diphosphatase UppP [Kofleriaceae bacterium]